RTGGVGRETVPDSVREQADEVELIDLPPDDLLQRFKEGKVYMPEQAQEALQNFFRKGNLIALRELALRRTAERVDAQMRVYMREHAIARVWPAAERLLVCVSPSPLSARLFLGSIVDALVQGSGDIDIYVISGEREDASPIAPVRRREIPIDWPAYGQAMAIVALTTGVAWLMSPLFELADLVMVYLLGIVVVAMRHGRGPSLVASILSVAAFDLFFVPPYFTFAGSDVRPIFTFPLMPLVGFVLTV